MNVGLLIVRVVFGLLFAVHGSQKLFGWFGGSGLSGTGQFFEGLGCRPGRRFAVADGLAECGGGVLLALGLFEPFAAAAIISVMIVAIVTVNWRNGLLAPNGIELPLLYTASALTLALTGPGAYSIDAVLRLSAFWTPRLTALAVTAAVLGGLASLAMRRPAQAVVAHA